MDFSKSRLLVVATVFFFIGLFSVSGFGQQVVQRGPLGIPAQVMDETEQWTTPLLVASAADASIYIPDVTSPDWVKRNYPAYSDRGVYTLSLFTFYKSPAACRANLIGWGLSDAEHLNACIDIGYRVRKALVDPRQKTVTLLMAAMIAQDGQIDPDSVQRPKTSRTWAQLDANTQQALQKTSVIVKKQMDLYNQKLQGIQ
jgi:hypothetical protein